MRRNGGERGVRAVYFSTEGKIVFDTTTMGFNALGVKKTTEMRAKSKEIITAQNYYS